MERHMTIQEIESEFDSEWVLIQDPETSEGREVLGGMVLLHSKDRDEVYRMAIAMTQRPKRIAIHFTGEMPEGTAVVL